MRAVGLFVEGATRGGVKRSIADQTQAFLDYCAEQGFEVASTFVEPEAGEPGTGYTQLLAYLGFTEHGFTVVTVDSLRALDRDLGAVALKILAIEQAGARPVSLQSGRELAQDLVDAWSHSNPDELPLGQRVRSAMREKAVRGTVLGRPPYGYRAGPNQRLEVVPPEASIVRQIFELYLHENLGIRRIAGRLNEHNVPTRRGGRWSMVTIRDILRNRAYLGTYTRFGVRVPGSHPPLVTNDEFRAVQARLEERATNTGNRTVEPFLLSGLVTCGQCGNRMIGVSRRQKWTTKDGEVRRRTYRYYQCESRTNQNTCGYNTQRAAELESRVRDVVSGEQPHASRVSRAPTANTFVDDTNAEIRRQEGRQRRIRRQVEELLADTAGGHISIDRFRDLGAGLAIEQHAVESEIGAARRRLDAQHSEEQHREALASQRERLARHWEDISFEERRLLVRGVVDEVLIEADDVKVYLRA